MLLRVVLLALVGSYVNPASQPEKGAVASTVGLPQVGTYCSGQQQQHMESVVVTA
jgi:hypothetical protein